MRTVYALLQNSKCESQVQPLLDLETFRELASKRAINGLKLVHANRIG